jgi:hypothetical protein
MKLSCITLVVLTAFFIAPAIGEEPASNKSEITLSSSQVSPTPQMWLYQQHLQEYLNPKLAVRRKAEFQARQRRARLESSRWFGLSKSRPLATPDPINGYYSPRWIGNNPLAPNLWSGYGQTPWVALNRGESLR